MSTAVQRNVEHRREVYGHLRLPLLQQLAFIHNLNVRDLAEIFGCSKSYIAEVFNHKKLPSLELAIRISRYFETTTDDLFGWRVDDDGSRRPLVVELPGTRQLIRLKTTDKTHGSMALIRMVSEEIQKQEKQEREGKDGRG